MSEQARNELTARRLDAQEFRRLRKVIEAQNKALRRIMHYPFAVTSNDQADLRAVKDIAAEAVAACPADPKEQTMSTRPEEAEVRATLKRLTEAFDHPDYFGSLVMLDEELARYAAVCDSWLAQGRVIEAQRDALQDAQGIALNGLPGVDSPEAKLDAIDVRIDAALAVYPADPKEQTYADRCPVCEGLDQPGLTHNTDAPYCSAADPKEQT